MTQLTVSVHTPQSEPPKTARGRRTWLKLLDAAEKEFGERGYHEAALDRITLSAGVARGTFYVHFKSKEEIFRAVVSQISHNARHWVAERVADAPDRFAAERQGLEAFIEFVRRHPEIYRIVHEAQFVAPDAYRAYYNEFAEGYRRGLAAAVARGEISRGEDEVRAWALTGAAAFLSMRFGIWDDSSSACEIANAAADLFEFGLRPRSPKA